MIRQYVGARYVPKFASPVEWASNTSYEALTIVTFNNASYTSKVPVPPTVGNPANNPQYWALTGNYNAQVEQYRQETEAVSNNLTTEITNRKNADTTLQGQITTVSNNLTTEITNRKTADDTLQNNIDAEAAARQSADNTLQGNINSEAATRSSADSNLQSQINQIVAPSGEAPSAAEVQNARIGADGVTYDTLGNAIRGQVNDLKSALSEVTTENICPNLYNPAEKTDGVILKADGTTRPEEIYSTTGFMDVSELGGKTVYFSYGNPTTGTASPAYGYVFYGGDKATVINSSIDTWQRTTVVPTGAYYLKVSVAKVVMESYYSVSTDSTLKYVAYYPPIIKLICQDQVDTNTGDIEALKNPTFKSYLTAYVKYPMKCGVRTDLYKQCILFGNKDKFAGFYSGNGVLHENSISYFPTDSSTLEEAYLTAYLDCTNADTASTMVVGVKPIHSTLGSGATPKIMLIGDSLTAMGVYQKYVNDLLSDAGITPTWLGSLTSTYGLHHEGRSGWRAYTYTNCANGSDDNASLDGTNAFYFNNAFDFSSYMSEQGYSSVDIVFINLGTNDFARSNHKDIAEVTGYWRTMIDSIHAYDSNIKVVLWLCPPPSDRNGIDAISWNARYKDHQMIMSFRGNAWGHDNIFILPSNLGVDPIYDFPYAEVAPNATSTERIIEATDTTHLSTTGFEHLAYPICGMIQYICGL